MLNTARTDHHATTAYTYLDTSPSPIQHAMGTMQSMRGYMGTLCKYAHGEER